MPAEAVARAAADADVPAAGLEVHVDDVYASAALPAGSYSVTIGLAYDLQDSTPETRRGVLVGTSAAVTRALGATLRGEL